MPYWSTPFLEAHDLTTLRIIHRKVMDARRYPPSPSRANTDAFDTAPMSGSSAWLKGRSGHASLRPLVCAKRSNSG